MVNVSITVMNLLEFNWTISFFVFLFFKYYKNFWQRLKIVLRTVIQNGTILVNLHETEGRFFVLELSSSKFGAMWSWIRNQHQSTAAQTTWVKTILCSHCHWYKLQYSLVYWASGVWIAILFLPCKVLPWWGCRSTSWCATCSAFCCAGSSTDFNSVKVKRKMYFIWAILHYSVSSCIFSILQIWLRALLLQLLAPNKKDKHTLRQGNNCCFCSIKLEHMINVPIATLSDKLHAWMFSKS